MEHFEMGAVKGPFSIPFPFPLSFLLRICTAPAVGLAMLTYVRRPSDRCVLCVV